MKAKKRTATLYGPRTMKIQRQPHILDPDTLDSILGNIWTKVANCLLKLSQLTFPRIRSLLQASKDKYEVAGRPVTLNMTEMVRLAHIPRIILPLESQDYKVADEWYTVLA
ncbi:hypothetical protein FVEG_15366 [Fusarium verticillioides 7600]|uniref:Uncharacterized protein n=1 Tax=Gibberella moniliformis (strain M3125 / FGSC 7600) TaxID=334819 RepID=W7M346_GIBM7|nr:hypothetical protein FVEG_15366 [Fusarium verticillioides 7600]EWG41939.1 hypothetical protein FVEG_15366 [Fusarium verticillioides 7600]